uniref:Uncharacterized protein n=1 Tax=Panagrolaimus sp. ES5 TaxID=591445 RepID=A0AC34FBH3_9BILA
MSFPPDPKAAQKSNNQKRNFDVNSKIHFQPSFDTKIPGSPEIPIKKSRHDESWRPKDSQEALQQIQKCFDEKIAAAAAAGNKSDERESKIETTTFEVPSLLQERIKKLEKDVAEVLEQVKKVTETLSNAENNKMEERIAAVLEEKLELRKEVVISKDPKWHIPEIKCKELYSYSQGQVARFLADYLPLLYDLPGIITPFKSDEKGEEARAVIDHFWNGSLTTDLCIKEIEKEHANQRYKTSRKIYQGLKNSVGCIMSKSGSIYECNFDEEKHKFIPKTGDFEILRPQNDDDEEFKIRKSQFEWAIPKDIYKEKFAKNDYMIVAKNDDSNQTRISKIDLETLEIQMLYTKRKYGNT